MWHVREIGEAHKGCWWGELMEEDLFEELDVDGRIIFYMIFKMCSGSVNWIDLAEDGDRWHAVVIAEMNLRLP
jgi:hypothetical protein